MAWHLNRALTNFRNAVNAAYPHRDKASDGTIGDAAHQATSSDHNPDRDGSVDAWDMDLNLDGAGKPVPAPDIEHLKQVFQAHESSQYWIHNRQIANRDVGNWRRRPYDGSSPHTEHVHWNTRESHEDSNVPWHINEEDDMPTAEEVAAAVWAYHDSPSDGRKRAMRDVLLNLFEAEFLRRSDSNKVQDLAAVKAAVTAIAGKVEVDPAELAAIQQAAQAGVVAAADQLADAIAARLPETDRDLIASAVREVFADAGQAG